MKKIFFSLFLLLSFSLIGTAHADVILGGSTSASAISSSGPVFTRSLTISSYGQDVEALKKILSLELGTTLDTSGTFTSATQAQVVQFQNKYAVDILIPVGLTAGTGYVGPSTNAKLNTLATQYGIHTSDFPVVAAPVIPTVVQAFTQNLSLGTNSDQVVLLKNVLNSDLNLQLGNTTLFDQATLNAVNQFQQKYASSILTPNGLTQPTGYVGPSTRAKLNIILAALNTKTATNTITGTTQNVSTQTNTSNTNLTTQADFTSNYPTTTASMCTTYTTGNWSACSQDGIQTRTVTAVTATSTGFFCSYSDKPESSQDCIPPELPTCPDNEDVAMGGHVDTFASCLNLPMDAFLMKSDTTYFTHQGVQCVPSEDRILWLNPATLFTAGITTGRYVNAPSDTSILGTLSTIKLFCATLSDSFMARVLTVDTKVSVE